MVWLVYLIFILKPAQLFSFRYKPLAASWKQAVTQESQRKNYWRFHYQWWMTWEQIAGRENQQSYKKNEDVTAVIQEFEEIIKSKKYNTVWIAYQQGKVFKRFKEKAKFIYTKKSKF